MRSNTLRRLAVIGAALFLMSPGLTHAGVVGGPQSESGTVLAGKNRVFAYQFEHYQDALIKVVFITEDFSEAYCDQLKVKMWVGDEWFFTGAGRYVAGGNNADDTCVLEVGYGRAHKYAKDRRKVTIQLINESSETVPFRLTTN